MVPQTTRRPICIPRPHVYYSIARDFLKPPTLKAVKSTNWTMCIQQVMLANAFEIMFCTKHKKLGQTTNLMILSSIH